jgi:hypothetical protein
MTFVLARAAGALALAASLWAPPALPPESTDGSPPTADRSAGQPDAPPPDAPPPDVTPPELPPDAGRTSLPPGLEPVPFPLEQQRSSEPTPLQGELLPPSPEPTKRRSIVDLRDPFNRPPPRPRPSGPHDATRLLMPDLKDPFAPGLRRVRSQRLDMHVPNDIRDPFRDRPRADGLRPPCARTTEDGTVVQKPGARREPMECPPAMMDLRDPFTR